VTPGSYRLRLESTSTFPLDETGAEGGRHLLGRHRLRLKPFIEVGWLHIHMEMDVLTGQIFGQTSALEARFAERRHGDPEREYDGWTTVEPRMAWLRVAGDWGFLELGQLGAHWGMGLLLSDGEERRSLRWVERFGDPWNGDLVQRARLGLRPFSPLTLGALGDLELALGVDAIYQDEDASDLDNDQGHQLHISLLYPGEGLHLGLLLLQREQEDRDGDQLSLSSIDLHSRWLMPLYGLGALLRLESELLFQMGETDRARPGGSPTGVDLLRLGWVARLELDWRCPRVATLFELGYASGDADPDDGQDQRLLFDPDYRAGFILFSDVLRWISLQGATRFSDPGLFGVAPASAEQQPTDGALHNAFYGNLGFTWRPGRWQLSAAGLLAWATEPVIDPYQSFRAGGTGRNHRGDEAASFYGVEGMGALHYTLGSIGIGHARLGAQGGFLLPGPALDMIFGESSVLKAALRLDLDW